ncbi:MAG: helix-turn-helix domain-containing protein [Pseudomonadota bacterium]
MKPQNIQPDQNSIPVFESRIAGETDVWMTSCAGIFGIAPLNQDDTKNHFRASSWFVDPITISNTRYSGMVAQRTNWHVEEAGGQIHMHRYALGRASVETDGLPIECDSGAITLLDYARPFRSIHTENECESFFVPHSAINYRPSNAPHAPVYSAQSVMGRLLGQEMDTLLSVLRGGARFIAPDDIRRFLGCVEMAMSPETASDGARIRLRESMKRAIMVFIEERLASPDICVTMVLKNFGLSRASLYRLFEAEDGVRSYISRRRLYRAVSDLAEAPHQRGHIHKVSERWGFSSDASFNRMVKREFGLTPGALFGMPMTIPESTLRSSVVSELMWQAARSDSLEMATA